MNELEKLAPGPLDLSAVRDMAQHEFDEAYDALMLDLLGKPPIAGPMTLEIEFSPMLLRHIQGLLP